MALRQYIGARYVPFVYGEWTPNTAYEALTIVTRNGNSYTSKRPVTANVGAPELNSEYWALTGSLNGQINELTNTVTDIETRVDELENDNKAVNAAPVNILLLGGKNDGSEDIGAIINEYTALYDLYLPAGTYLLTTKIVLKHSLIGAHSNQYYANGCTLINSIIESGEVISIEETSTPSALTIKGIMIDCNDYPVRAISYTPAVRVYLDLIDICVMRAKDAFYFYPSQIGSRNIMASNIRAFGARTFATAYESRGIYLNNCHDCSFSDVYIMGYNICVENHSGGHRFTSCHFYCANGSITGNDLTTYYAISICVNTYDKIMADNIYLDNALQYWVQREKYSEIGNMVAWNDGYFDDLGRTDAGILSIRGNARIAVNNLIVGGSKSPIGLICDPRYVTIDHFYTEWGSYDNAASRVLANNLRIGTKQIFNILTSDARYIEAARIRCNNNGYVKFALNIGSGSTVFEARITSVGAIASVKKLSELIPFSFYYKMDGNDCVIFYDKNTTEAQTSQIYCSILDNGGYNNGLIDYDAYSTLAKLTQNDLSGFTEIVA